MWFAWCTVRFWSIALIFVHFLPVACISYYLTLKMEPVHFSKTSVNFCQTSRSHISEGIVEHCIPVISPFESVLFMTICVQISKVHLQKCRTHAETLLVLEQVQYCYSRIFCIGRYTVLPPYWNILQESVVYMYFFGIFFIFLRVPLLNSRNLESPSFMSVSWILWHRF
jgi:hypothetical protein